MNSKCPKCNDTGEILLLSSTVSCECIRHEVETGEHDLVAADYKERVQEALQKKLGESLPLRNTPQGRDALAKRVAEIFRANPFPFAQYTAAEICAAQPMTPEGLFKSGLAEVSSERGRQHLEQYKSFADETEATAVRCSSEIDKLAKWFQTIAPKEIVEGSAVDNAIAYMERLRATARDGVATGTLTVTDCVVEPVPPTTTVTAVNCSVVQSNKEERASLVSFLLAACPDHLPLVEGIQTLVRGYEKELKEREDIPGECCLRASRHVAVLSEALRRTRWLLGPLDQPADLSQKKSENFLEKPRSNRERGIAAYWTKRLRGAARQELENHQTISSDCYQSLVRSYRRAYESAEADRAILQKEIDTLTWWFRENAPEEIGHGSSVKSAISLLERLTKID